MHVCRNSMKKFSWLLGVICLFFIFIPINNSLAEETEADESTNTNDNNEVVINETTTNGFTHPGVGLTKPVLENLKEQLLAEKEPWNTYYQEMLVSSTASKEVESSNQSEADPTKPASDTFNSKGIQSRFISDSLKAYTQSLLYYITGEEVYRENAMHIIRIWSQMDPNNYNYYQDAHIHTGIPLNRMVTAAELLRYTSSPSEELEWTDEDTEDFTNNLVMPVIDTFQYDNNHFMNQHNYPLLGAMAGYIFTNNEARYQEAVEWFTVNETADNQGYNGSIKQLFRLIDTNAETGEKLEDPVVQNVEMGRDQAHGGGDLTNSTIISRMLLAQDTKVDPDNGEVSTNNDAVGPYEFQNNRILETANYFWQYMLGYETPWTPVPYVYDDDGGIKGIYHKLSDSYRGRMVTANFWDLYYYYTYEKGINLEEKAPYYVEAFKKRIPLNYYYQGDFKQNWENVDGGGDFWLYIPEEAAAEGADHLPKPQNSDAYIEIEERYTAFDDHSSTKSENETSFIQMNATEEGSKIAALNLSYEDRTDSRLVGLKFRSNGTATVELSKEIDSDPYHTLTLPNTEGEWRYITYDMGVDHVSYGELDKDYSLLYMNVKGDSTTVDFDHLYVKAGEQLTPPEFEEGSGDIELVTFIDAPISLDFSASDADNEQTLSYQGENLPENSSLNSSTGEFIWNPTENAKASFLVTISDGTTVATKNVQIIVKEDRETAIAEITSAYDEEETYIEATQKNYIQANEETLQIVDSASNEDFYQQLITLQQAVDQLQLVTPLLEDGSMDYTKAVKSNIGDSIDLLVDNNNNTYPQYTLAPDMQYTLDFGADYKVSATSIAMQGRMNFVDRMAGSAAFGSNDGINWTRITPDETAFIRGMSTIEVAEDFHDEKFRFIKVEKINPQRDVLHDEISMLYEPSELRIFGTRYETNNKLESVSISSDQAVAGRITKGDNVTLSIKAKEELEDVTVNILEEVADVSTDDGINWTAEIQTSASMPTGEVKFEIDYTDQEGNEGEPTYLTTDDSKLYLSDDSKLIADISSKTDYIDSTTASGRSESETKKQVGYLFDNDPSTNSDFRLNGSGSESYITFDFKEGREVQLETVEILARQDRYYSRIKGAVIQGSNDNQTWETLTNEAESTMDWQSLRAEEADAYRYIRIFNQNNWFGNMAEIKFHGDVIDHNKIQNVSLYSENSLVNRIVPEDKVSLSFESIEEISEVDVQIQGQQAAIQTEDNIHFEAELITDKNMEKGEIAFSINYIDQSGASRSYTIDNSELFLVDESNLLDLMEHSPNLLDSTENRSDEDTLENVNHLFDHDVTTFSDFRTGSDNVGHRAYITFDLTEENRVQLSQVEILARQDQYYTRVEGTLIQGSNDNETWTDLTAEAESIKNWQQFDVDDNNTYRYIRIYNHRNWFGNIAEVRFHGEMNQLDDTPPITEDNAPNGWVNQDVDVHLSAMDDKSGVKETFYQVNNGQEKIGTDVKLTKEGKNKLVYWSIDQAGNREEPKTKLIKIDKTVPSVSLSDFSEEEAKSALMLQPTVTLTDALSGVSDEQTKIEVNGEVMQSNEKIWLCKLPLGTHSILITGSDLAGNIVEKKITFQTVASIQKLQKLVDHFKHTEDIANQGIANSLQKKLKKDNLRPFINQVHALEGKKISQESSHYLLRDANVLID